VRRRWSQRLGRAGARPQCTVVTRLGGAEPLSRQPATGSVLGPFGDRCPGWRAGRLHPRISGLVGFRDVRPHSSADAWPGQRWREILFACRRSLDRGGMESYRVRCAEPVRFAGISGQCGVFAAVVPGLGVGSVRFGSGRGHAAWPAAAPGRSPPGPAATPQTPAVCGHSTLASAWLGDVTVQPPTTLVSGPLKVVLRPGVIEQPQRSLLRSARARVRGAWGRLFVGQCGPTPRHGRRWAGVRGLRRQRQ
jgi:hypothetical protein